MSDKNELKDKELEKVDGGIWPFSKEAPDNLKKGKKKFTSKELADNELEDVAGGLWPFANKTAPEIDKEPKEKISK